MYYLKITRATRMLLMEILHNPLRAAVQCFKAIKVRFRACPEEIEALCDANEHK